MRSFQQQIYTPDEVAQILKISKHTVYELVKRGELNAFRVGNKFRIDAEDLEMYIQNMRYSVQSVPRQTQPTKVNDETVSSLRIAGSHDLLIEQLTHLKKLPPSQLLHSTNIGSLEGLMTLYQGRSDIAAIHLLDPVTKEYNLPFVQRFFIREPVTVLRFAVRTQGFIVAKNNPKRIRTWDDLLRDDITFMNRQKGSGTRFLLDAELTERKLPSEHIQGYAQEAWTHVDAAAAVACGSADVALGIEAAAQKLGLTFISLTTESFDLVCKWTPENSTELTHFHELLQSNPFHENLQPLDGYDYSQLGDIIYQVNV